MQRSTLVKFLAGLLLTSLSFTSESESFSVVFDFLQPQGILQARILEWLAFPFSRGSSWPRNRTRVSCIAGGFFTNWAIREALSFSRWMFNSTLACSHFVSMCRVNCSSTEHFIYHFSLTHLSLLWVSQERASLQKFHKRWLWVQVYPEQGKLFNLFPYGKILGKVMDVCWRENTTITFLNFLFCIGV